MIYNKYMATINWIVISAIGFIDIMLQALMPDLVPEAITMVFVNNPQIVGVNPLLQATLILYIIGGYILFLGGLTMACLSSQSE
jgi:hypothetical protein